jgi:hypothetical protein
MGFPMDSQVKEIIRRTISEMLKESTSSANIRNLERKHLDKVHFIPIKYRIIGGILQGLNIKFGNFIETLIGNIVEIDPGVEAMPDSGRKLRLYFTHETDALIDNYITERQLPNSPDDCTPQFDNLLQRIVEIELAAEDDQRQGIVKDIDALFRVNGGLIVYTELKYNDDHDTGKFADINRKFIKTWAGLAVRLHIKKPEELIPIIYYFNATKRYGPIHTPSRNILRGPQLFDRFLETKYSDVDRYLSEIGNDPEILKIFDDMYQRVRNGETRGPIIQSKLL